MGMPKEEKKKTLLQAASDVLMEYGPYKTTLDDIARRAGMAKTSLYYYFKDKDEIIRAIIKNDMEQLLDIMTRAVASAQTAEEKIYALCEARYQFLSSKTPRANKDIIDEFRSLAGVFASVKEHYLQVQKELIEKILREGIQKGELKPIEDLDLISLIMIVAMFGVDHTFLFYDQRDRMLEGIKQMNRIFFEGLRVSR
jgi:AcrR family transcriptional regulator